MLTPQDLARVACERLAAVHREQAEAAIIEAERLLDIDPGEACFHYGEALRLGVLAYNLDPVGGYLS